MSKTAKLYDEIKGYYETFETEHEKHGRQQSSWKSRS